MKWVEAAKEGQDYVLSAELKEKRALIYSGARRQILDLYPLGLKFHALRFNKRGIIRGRWEDKINQLLNMSIQYDNTNDL